MGPSVEKFRNYADWKQFSATKTFAQSRKRARKVNNNFWFQLKTQDVYKGRCTNCETESTFRIDRQHAIPNDLGGLSSLVIRKKINFRERLTCENCHLNQRMRSNLQVIGSLIDHSKTETIWLQEQLTPFYEILLSRYSIVIGSEFYGPNLKMGSMYNGVRHEDATSSSFENDSLSAVLSFDVLEHIPNYRNALTEAHRVLVKGGLFLWTAPFNLNRERTETRAKIEDGEILHLLEPEFHGDPVNPDRGILCFQTFGWDVLEDMGSIGFKNVEVIWNNNSSEAILSLENVTIVGYKA